MDKETALEVYKQRYEVWRHLDKLRWQLVQLLVAIFSASALVVRATEGAVEWWFTLALSTSLIAIAFSMHRISGGIRRNQKMLRTSAEIVGDTDQPDVNQMGRSVYHWLTVTVGLAGVGFLFKSIFTFLYGDIQ
jgi:hypothetical protein